MQNNTKAVVEGALLAAITIILSLLSLYIPILGTFASLVWPVPIILLGIRHGVKISLLATIVSGIIVAMLEGPLQAFTVVLGFGLIGIALGWAISKDFSAEKCLAVGTIASLVAKVLLILISLYIMGINPINEEIAALKESIEQVSKIYTSIGMNKDTVNAITQNFSQTVNLLSMAIPGVFVLASVVDAFLNYSVAKIVIARLGSRIRDFTPFWQWKLPTFTVFFFLIGVLLTFLEQYWPVGILKYIGMNLQLVFYFAFFIEGFSLLAYYFGKYNVSKPVRILTVLFIFFNPFFTQIIVWAGMFDILMNFRKL
ncbi:MAG: YybS family protein [Thermovenabulum sp.]|uniref:YybS family protein n=1 Tax=Thermovenabulum sp. TaxID=3100335 RepID=UPI003C7C0BBB